MTLRRDVEDPTVPEVEPVSTEQSRRRSRANMGPRSVSIPEKWSDERARPLLGENVTPHRTARPRTRGDCLPGGSNEQRPCPWAGCRHHNLIEVDPETGSLKLNHNTTDVSEIGETCSLDRADNGVSTLDEVGVVLNVTRERTRQIEVDALIKIAPHLRGFR